MRNRKKNWIFRRVVVGLAVAAIVAPAAQARLYEGGAGQSDGNNSVLIQGDDKVRAPETGSVLVQGDDKVLAPEGHGALIVKGDDKVIVTPAHWQYNEHGYVQGHYGEFATQIRDTEPIQGQPAGRQVPIAATGTQSDFGWSDGLLVGAAAVALALLAFGAVRSTREMRRPAPSV
jgi:hypothetical protein